MPTNYPGALDSFTNPDDTGGDTLADVPHDGQHTDNNDATVAIETELGVNPRGSHADVRARLDRVEQTPAAGISRGALQSVADSTFVKVEFDTEDFAGGVTVDLTAGNHDLTVVTAGIYLVTLYARWSSNSTGRRIYQIHRNGGRLVEDDRPSQNEADTTVTGVHALVATDVIAADVRQESGGALDLVHAELRAVWLRPTP